MKLADAVERIEALETRVAVLEKMILQVHTSPTQPLVPGGPPYWWQNPVWCGDMTDLRGQPLIRS